MPESTATALTRGSRQHVWAVTPREVMPPLECPATPIAFGAISPVNGPSLARVSARSSSIRKLTSAGWFAMSPASGAPGPPPLESGKRGAATTYPAAASCVSSGSYVAGVAPRPCANTTRGYGPLAESGAACSTGAAPTATSVEGYQTVVSSVRPGCFGRSSLGGVGRLRSTYVFVTTPTPCSAVPAAAAAPGAPLARISATAATDPRNDRRIARGLLPRVHPPVMPPP